MPPPPLSPCPRCGNANTTWLEFTSSINKTNAYVCQTCRTVWQLRAEPGTEHQRLLERTEELRDQHAALQRKPFDAAEHAEHQRQLTTHLRYLRRDRKEPL